MPSPVKDQEIAAEQRLVDQAYERLEEMRDAAQAMIKEGYRQAQAGTRASLVDRDAMVHQAAQRVQALNVADDGLVFGRLDITGAERRYVGRIGVRTSEHESLVIDWRAPAAEAFYRATPEDPRGVIRRRVLHSRGHQVIDIEDDLLAPDSPEAEGLTVVGDGAFLASLARTREGSMRDIVATIQREQDEVIRAPADGTVIVRGGPGTGKTAVALHRVAYLLFHHRRRYGSRGVLIVGPNRRFTAYIDRVLPSLGEGTAALRSLGDLVEGISATRHDPPELVRIKGAGVMARVLRHAVTDHPPGAPHELRAVFTGVVLKLDRGRIDRIRDEVHRRSRGSINRARSRAADLLIDALWQRFEAVGGLTDAPDTKRAEFAESIREQRSFTGFLQEWWPIRRPEDVLRSLGDQARLRQAAGRDLRPEQISLLAASFAALPQERSEAGTGSGFSYQDVALLDEIAHLLGPPPRAHHEAVENDDPYALDGVDIISGERIGPESYGVRELTTSIERMEKSRRGGDELDADAGAIEDYGHVVVDEAQDLSPMQWRMLGRRGRHATWTVVEDPAQSAWEDLSASRQAMDTALGIAPPPGAGDDGRTSGRQGGGDRGRGGRGRRGRDRGRQAAKAKAPRPVHNFELTTNYRNSVEIAEVATRMLAQAVPDARPARAVRVSGLAPDIQVVDGPIDGPAVRAAAREAVAGLLEQVEGTIGLITPVTRDQEVAGLWAAVAEGLPERVQVLDVLDAKGLEFDAAVIVTPEAVAAQSPTGLRVLYVAVSRATQHLTVLTTDPGWSDLLTGRSTTLPGGSPSQPAPGPQSSHRPRESQQPRKSQEPRESQQPRQSQQRQESHESGQSSLF